MTLIFENWLFLVTKMNLIVQWEWECMWKMGVDSIYFIKIKQLILFFIIIYLIIKTTFIFHNQKHFQENKNKNKIKEKLKLENVLQTKINSIYFLYFLRFSKIDKVLNLGKKLLVSSLISLFYFLI